MQSASLGLCVSAGLQGRRRRHLRAVRPASLRSTRRRGNLSLQPRAVSFVRRVRDGGRETQRQRHRDIAIGVRAVRRTLKAAADCRCLLEWAFGCIVSLQRGLGARCLRRRRQDALHAHGSSRIREGKSENIENKHWGVWGLEGLGFRRLGFRVWALAARPHRGVLRFVVFRMCPIPSGSTIFFPRPAKSDWGTWRQIHMGLFWGLGYRVEAIACCACVSCGLGVPC